MATKAKTVRFDKKGLLPGEYSWLDEATLTDEQFESRLGAALNYYAANVDRKVLKKDFLEYVKPHLNKDDYALVRDNFESVPFTFFKLARMISIGMPAKRIRNTHKVIMQSISALTAKLNAATVTETTNATKAISPLERTIAKAAEAVLPELETMLDSWLDDTSKMVEPIDIVEVVKSKQIPVQGFAPIVKWVETFMTDLQGAIDKTDEYSMESYSHLKMGVKRSWYRALETILSDLDKYKTKHKEAQKKDRKPRKTKPLNRFQARKALLKKVTRIKYLAEDAGITSINPEQIIGAFELYVYNNKYKELVKYTAMGRSGLDTKGTTIQNFNEALSFKVKLRKPEELLELFKDPKVTQKKIEAALALLKTKKNVPNGRINANTLLLVAFGN